MNEAARIVHLKCVRLLWGAKKRAILLAQRLDHPTPIGPRREQSLTTPITNNAKEGSMKVGLCSVHAFQLSSVWVPGSGCWGERNKPVSK
jgi:hypothetical protein